MSLIMGLFKAVIGCQAPALDPIMKGIRQDHAGGITGQGLYDVRYIPIIFSWSWPGLRKY